MNIHKRLGNEIEQIADWGVAVNGYLDLLEFFLPGESVLIVFQCEKMKNLPEYRLTFTLESKYFERTDGKPMFELLQRVVKIEQLKQEALVTALAKEIYSELDSRKQQFIDADSEISVTENYQTLAHRLCASVVKGLPICNEELSKSKFFAPAETTPSGGSIDWMWVNFLLRLYCHDPDRCKHLLSLRILAVEQILNPIEY